MQILCSFYNKYFEDLFFKEHDLRQHPDITMVFLVTQIKKIKLTD